MMRYPKHIGFFTKALAHQYRAAQLRNSQFAEGIEVPALLIISITRKCNLNCAGCYSKILHTKDDHEIEPERFRAILEEAVALGVSIIMLAGGEPLVRRDLLEVAADYPQVLFPVFTNGLLMDDAWVAFFARNPHLILVVSLEGGKSETDQRRGDGVFSNFQDIIPKLNKSKIFWGVSLTLTSQNMDLILSPAYAKDMLAQGSRLFFFVEYVPISEGSDDLILSDTQKDSVQPRVDELQKDLPGLFIAFPGDEDQYGGCLASGRGFLHVNPNGFVEPCPFAPFSDTNLRYSSLKEALKSDFLAKIRENHHLLKESRGGCALWANKQWVEEIKNQSGS